MILIPVSIGEVFDKLSILDIKRRKITDETKLSHVTHELESLQSVLTENNIEIDATLWQQLITVNQTLWDIEDAIRDKERQHQFDAEFIELARSVYFTNDERAAIKGEINIKYGSDLVEIKSYTTYANCGRVLRQKCEDIDLSRTR